MTDDRPIDVAVLTLGIDARARGEIQRAMDELASTGDTSTPAGLVRMLREAVAVLRCVEASWTHAGVENASPMPPPEAEGRFGEAAHRARARFDHELVRNYGGETTRAEAPELAPSETPGRVVVTLVLAARRELRDAAEKDRASLSLALDDFSRVTPEEFVAIEVIWSPADPKDRMSLAAMEERYPELFRLGELVA